VATAVLNGVNILGIELPHEKWLDAGSRLVRTQCEVIQPYTEPCAAEVLGKGSFCIK